MLKLSAISRQLGEELETSGFAVNRARAYVREAESGLFQCIQAQGSKYADEQRFTINVSVVDRAVEARLGYEYPEDKPIEASRGILVLRASSFSSLNDLWWSSSDAGVDQARELLRVLVVPALDRTATRRLLIEAWRDKLPPWSQLPLLSAAALLENQGAEREARGVVMHALEVDAEVPARAETFRRFLATMVG